jgi:leucyl-tRNA synthetase
VFTTRIDTIFGATAIVVAAEHPVLDEVLQDSGVERSGHRFRRAGQSRARHQD